MPGLAGLAWLRWLLAAPLAPLLEMHKLGGCPGLARGFQQAARGGALPASPAAMVSQCLGACCCSISLAVPSGAVVCHLQLWMESLGSASSRQGPCPSQHLLHAGIFNEPLAWVAPCSHQCFLMWQCSTENISPRFSLEERQPCCASTFLRPGHVWTEPGCSVPVEGMRWLSEGTKAPHPSCVLGLGGH